MKKIGGRTMYLIYKKGYWHKVSWFRAFILKQATFARERLSKLF